MFVQGKFDILHITRVIIFFIQGHKHDGNIRIDAVLDELNQHVLAGSEDGNVYVWDLLTAAVTNKLTHG